MNAKPWLPQEIDEITMAFPANVMHLMPPYDDIPEYDSKWEKLVSDWFFAGVRDLKLTPKEGIDQTKAFRHIKAILGSFEPKHEHKEAACAYLLSLWFDDAQWETGKRSKS